MNSSARTLHEAAMNGFKRVRNFRKARLMYVKAYTGKYYHKLAGEIGDEPLNMAFSAIRALVPNLVTQTPEVRIESDYLAYRRYGEILALGINSILKKLRYPKIAQRAIVDALFTLGIFKVGLSTSDSIIQFGDESIDPGEIYVDTVDFDDFTFDPDTRQLEIADFIGDRIRVERDRLLESGLYDNAAIEKLPSSSQLVYNGEQQTKDITQPDGSRTSHKGFHDYIDLVELWLPDPNVIVTVPYKGDSSVFLREEDYYGPDTGPYTFLSLTPPVPNNPLPIALAGIWHDLHVVANRMAKKTIDQAEAQKDILGYQRQYADDAQEIVDAKNLDAVPMEDPNAAAMYSFGGQNPRNEQMIAQLQGWFNQFSGNTDMLAGMTIGQADSATEASILDRNSNMGVRYMQDQVYDATREIVRKLAWYLHSDPLVQLPLIERKSIPAEYSVTERGIQMIRPPQTEEQQLILTPEVRQGDFLDFAFEIIPDSMAPRTRAERLKQLEMLTVRIIPAAAQAAMMMAQIGAPFSFRSYVINAAKLLGITWAEEIFQDPDLAAQLMQMAQMGPQPLKAEMGVQQNQQSSMVQRPSPEQPAQQRQDAQAGANEGQRNLAIRENAR